MENYKSNDLFTNQNNWVKINQLQNIVWCLISIHENYGVMKFEFIYIAYSADQNKYLNWTHITCWREERWWKEIKKYLIKSKLAIYQ